MFSENCKKLHRIAPSSCNCRREWRIKRKSESLLSGGVIGENRGFDSYGRESKTRGWDIGKKWDAWDGKGAWRVGWGILERMNHGWLWWWKVLVGVFVEGKQKEVGANIVKLFWKSSRTRMLLLPSLSFSPSLCEIWVSCELIPCSINFVSLDLSVITMGRKTQTLEVLKTPRGSWLNPSI